MVQIKYCLSNDYDIYRVWGKDKVELLHNISTNNIKEFMEQKNKINISSLFLEPKGRILTDFQLIKPQQYKDRSIQNTDEDELWVKLPKEASQIFEKQMKIYSFKKEFQFQAVTRFLDLLFVVVFQKVLIWLN